MDKKNYYSIFFNYDGQDYIADAQNEAFLSKAELFILFMGIIADNGFTRSTVTDIELSRNEEVIFQCEQFNFRDGDFSLSDH